MKIKSRKNRQRKYDKDEIRALRAINNRNAEMQWKRHHDFFVVHC